MITSHHKKVIIGNDVLIETIAIILVTISVLQSLVQVPCNKVPHILLFTAKYSKNIE